MKKTLNKVRVARIQAEPYAITDAQRDLAKARRPFNAVRDKAKRKG